MEVTLHIPDDVAKRLSASGGDVSRRALEALALEGYREQALTLYQVSEMLGLSRVQTEDFLGRHQVPLAVIDEADLDREAALFDTASQPALTYSPGAPGAGFAPGDLVFSTLFLNSFESYPSRKPFPSANLNPAASTLSCSFELLTPYP